MAYEARYEKWSGIREKGDRDQEADEVGDGFFEVGLIILDGETVIGLFFLDKESCQVMLGMES